MRIKFEKGEQRKFLENVISLVDAGSLMELSRRLDVSYSTMKNYYICERLLPKVLFDDLCYISGIDKKKLKVSFVEDNWGQVKGGGVGKR